MPSIDRQIGVLGGWVAGPSAGLAMMAAPEYLNLHPVATACCFWIGVVLFGASVAHVGWVHLRERGYRMSGPFLVMAASVVTFLSGAAWAFWPKDVEKPSTDAVETRSLVTAVTECSGLVPSIAVPADGILRFYLLSDFGDGRGFGVVGNPARPGTLISPETLKFYNRGLNCKITVYSEDPIFSSEVIYSVSLSEALLESNGLKSGKSLGMIKLVVNINQLNPTQNTYEFVIMSDDAKSFALLNSTFEMTFVTGNSPVRQAAKTIPMDAPVLLIPILQKT